MGDERARSRALGRALENERNSQRNFEVWKEKRRNGHRQLRDRDREKKGGDMKLGGEGGNIERR